MPLVKIEMLAGKPLEYKKTVFDCVHEGLIEAFGMEIPEEKSENFMIIELTIFPGRTKEQKKAAIKIITDKLSQRLDISPTDIFIVMNEPPLDNWGMGGKQKS